jgi:hypothetical protein
MKIDELTEDALYEMSSIGWKTTGLPSNITVWVRSDPINHGHNRYRVKILKDKQWAAIYSVGSAPMMLKNINNSIMQKEDGQIKQFITQFAPHIINLIDCVIDTVEFEMAVRKERGS